MSSLPRTAAVAAGLAVVAAVAVLAFRAAPPEPTAGIDGRLVTLSPPITQTVVALGAVDQLVGRSDWDTRPASILHLPAVGSTLAPNLEAIVGLAPTAVLTEQVQAGRAEELRAVAPTVELPWLTLADVQASVRSVGALTGHDRDAATLADRFADVLDVAPPADGPTLLLTLGVDDLPRGQLWFIKPDSLHGHLVPAVGLRHALQGPVDGAPVLGVEALLALDPDVIVILSAEDGVTPQRRAELVAAFDALTPLTAVQRHAIGVLSGPEVMDTGPGILDLVPRLRAELDAIAADR